MERWWSVASPDPAPLRRTLALVLALLAVVAAFEQWRLEPGGRAWLGSVAVALLAFWYAHRSMSQRRAGPWSLRVALSTRLALTGVAEWQRSGDGDANRGSVIGCEIVSCWQCAGLVFLRLRPFRDMGMSDGDSRRPVDCCVRRADCGADAWAAVLRAVVRQRRSSRNPRSST